MRPNSKIINICDMPIAIKKSMAEILGLDSELKLLPILWIKSFWMVDKCMIKRAMI